jgi:hypothetical protein
MGKIFIKQHDTYLTAGHLIRQLKKVPADTPVLAICRSKQSLKEGLLDCRGTDFKSIMACGPMGTEKEGDDTTIFALEIKK